MVNYENIIYSKNRQKNKQKVGNRMINPRNIRLQVFIDQKHNELIADMQLKHNLSVSEAVYNIISKYFVIEKELENWQKIAKAQFDVQKEMEAKLKKQGNEASMEVKNE